MSSGFMSKLSGLREGLTGSGSGQGPQNPKTARWLRIVAKVMGAIGGFVACISALIAMISLHPLCIVSALLLLIVAIILLIFEAPMCCMFIDKTKPIAEFAERRTYVQKAIIYIVMAILPLCFCFSFAALFGCGLIFITGLIYGYMGLGKRGETDETVATGGAAEPPPPPYVPRPDDTRSGLIENDDNFRNMQSSFAAAGGVMQGVQAAQQAGYGPGGKAAQQGGYGPGSQAAQQGGYGPGGQATQGGGYGPGGAANMQNTFAAASGAMQGMQTLHGAYTASSAMHGNY